MAVSIPQPPVDFQRATRALERSRAAGAGCPERDSARERGGVHERAGPRERLALWRVFAGASLRYWLTVFPLVCRELARWRRRAAEIEEPTLRRLALEALEKRGNIEGAAAFAAFVPRRRRRAVVRALCAFQTAYNYADMLAEQPSTDPVANGRRLHEALLLALDPAVPHPDYYQHHPQRDTGRYMEEIVERCRAALARLPAYPAVAPAARVTAERIVACQSLSLGEPRRARQALRDWAREHMPVGADLEWWEAAAAGGSSLGVFVMVAAAAESAVDPRELAAVEGLYWPWIGALHSLLDSLVDEAEDAAIGQLSLVGCYATREDAARRMGSIAARAMRGALRLRGGERHAVLVAAMTGHYLSAGGGRFARGAPPRSLGAGAQPPTATPIATSVTAAVGALAEPIGLMLGVRGLAGRCAR